MGTGYGEILNQSILNIDQIGNIHGFQGILTILLSIALFLWILSIIWTAKDIVARTDSILLQIISILLVTFLTPIIGLPVYKVIRPLTFKKDRIPWREACANSLIQCYNCHTLNPKEYSCCIQCGEHLKIKCKECGTYYPHSYLYCNDCGAPNLDT